MRLNQFKATIKTAIFAVCILLLGVSSSFAQQQVNLTAAATSITLPDGSTVPMWGYACGSAVGGSLATCAPLNTGGGWSPVVITVPSSASGGLAINLTNNLPASVPTSLTIVGQLGGGLGNSATNVASPTHATQGATWPVGDPTVTNDPPPQNPRVQSFSTEVAHGATTPLPPWSNLRPGTYLIESGTHPSIQGPMGLYGILVVTAAPAGTTAGTAYPGVTYNAELPLVFSEIDPVQNRYVDDAVNQAGFNELAVWSGAPGACGDVSQAHHTCYPPVVNYSPLYYLINGVAFDKTKASASLLATSPATASGTVLVRMVNAGLRMHVPSIVGSQTGSAASGFTLVAEDGNVLPGVPRVQSEVFLAAGKTYDVKINVPAAGATALPVFDRQLSLSSNATARDAGMLAYISVNGAGLPASPAFTGPVAVADTYNSIIAGKTLTISDPGKGVIANDSNISGVQVVGPVTGGTLTLNTDGTFTFAATAGSGGFTYCGNGATSGPACATVTLGAAAIEAASGITVNADAYSSTVATSLSIKSPGVLDNDADAAGYPLTVDTSSVSGLSGPGTGTLSVDATGSFNLTNVNAPGTYTFTYKAKNSQGTSSATAATVTVVFPSPSHLAVTLIDGLSKTALSPQDYRWIIEEDRTFHVDPNVSTSGNPTGGDCVNNPAACAVPQTFGANFHTSYMPVVADGCTGDLSCESGQTRGGQAVVCDVGNGDCRPGVSKNPVLPGDVALDPTKHYYLSVLPGDAMGVDGTGGGLDASHAMGGSPVTYNASTGQWNAVNVIVEPMDLPPAKVSVFVFEDDYPLNGEHDATGGVDTLAPLEAGLGGFNITLFDDVGQNGDAAGQMTYDMSGQPLSNALAGTPDPTKPGVDACPVVKNPSTGIDGAASDNGITGVVPVCPYYESDGVTLSPLAGQAVIANLPPGRYGVVASEGADRIAKGEEWLQTNTLDGGFAHDSFVRANEPAYFQEYGPAGFHVSIGFANPAIINSRKATACAGVNCSHNLTGKITGAHMSRTPDERLFSTGTRDTFGYSQCYVSFGSPDGADFAFSKCDENGVFHLTGIPSGDWRITVFDQWDDQVLDGISTPVRVSDSGDTDIGDVAVHQWKSDLYTQTFIDVNGNGVRDDGEQGLTLVPTNVRYRDGSYSNFNSTDLDGNAGFNEVFPLFNWYVVETDATRYKNAGTHVVYDAGGPVDPDTTNPTATQTAQCTNYGVNCGNSATGANLARTVEDSPLPPLLRIPGAKYCDAADCDTSDAGGGHSTGRIDPPWVDSYGWQSFIGQNNFLEFGKKPFAQGENGGIRGHVIYTSTRPFDDPALLLQLSWEPMVPNVTINLYQVGTAPDGTESLTKVDTTKTSSWDEWAQGFRSDGIPNMNCPGQKDGSGDFFFYTLFNQPFYLDAAKHALPNNSQFKCFDGMHNWNQLQPAPYDGMYRFPSVTGRDPLTGNTTGTNCTICTKDNDATDPFRFGKEDMLPPGKYVVEMIVPPGYELVKEEDKNILMGDTYVAPVTTQFAGFGNIFIMPDQAAVGAAYQANNPLIPSNDEGVIPRHEGDTGSVETFWPCVGAERIVPDYMSLFPGSGQNAPFAGAKRNLCDRKEVTLEDQMTVLAKFYVFTATHVAAHFTGLITDDLTAEFDPYSPAFGEKFAPPFMPISIKDWAGNEISRVYSDQWGAYNGMTFSSWGVNPPDPSGYVPQMMVTCMNDMGDPAHPDPAYQKQYSQFCYENPFMPGETQYLDTPVVPTSAFAGAGYNNPDCDYPDATPAIAKVTSSDIAGPWVSAAGHTLTITALGDQQVNNYGYSGPSAASAPFNQRNIPRHYGFGAPGTVALVGADGIAHALTSVSWTDSTITGTVPTGVPNCSVQQQAQYGGPGTPGVTTAQCGQLVITTGAGKQSVDTVTVTIGGKAPIVLSAGQSIQSAVDAASPGDMVIVPPGSYNEMVIMWKPVRLQGVGAASSVINSTTHPSGQLLQPWRKRIVCLFGMGESGVPADWSSACADSSWKFFTASKTNPQIDRLPLEATVGWDATLNGNLAEQLQEPTLMGAYEGAGITVLGKGVRFPNGSDPFASDVFPDNTQLLTSTTNGTLGCGANTRTAHNPFPSNFYCNPSRIDGLGVTNASQGGGGIFIHAWGHNLEVSNNRVSNNLGSLAGGITVGQGEHPEQYLGGAAGAGVNTIPGSCVSRGNNQAEPYCFDRFVNIHNNAVVDNSSLGDELFSSTPAGAGGISIANGSDGYKLQWNWVCGNLSTGDGGGVSHIGYSEDGLIQHNTIIFNQTTNPTISTNGGGLLIMGAPDADPTCTDPFNPDADCHVAALSDGSGNLTVNANLILGNAADSGAGGGIRLQAVNGTDVQRSQTGNASTQGTRWNKVTLTNNIIANNVAGWDGGGISLQDSLNIEIINNTIVDNDTTASAGELFTTFRSGLASSPIPGNLTSGANTSAPQPSGISSSPNSDAYSLITGSVTCPTGHGTSGNTATCKRYSIPRIQNDIVRGNRSYYIGVGAFDANHQQNTVKLFSAFTTTPLPNQSSTGSCNVGGTYWDIGVRGDQTLTGHESGITLAVANTLLSTNSDPNLVRPYCNGSRIPPEFGGTGFQVPPGTNEANATPLPLFDLMASATVDEGNNWVNVSWGPLSLVNPTTNVVLGDYRITAASTAAVNLGSNLNGAPLRDYFDAPRSSTIGGDGHWDIGAVEVQGVTGTILSVSPTSLNFGNVAVGATSASQTVTLTNSGTTGATGIGVVVTAPFSRAAGGCATTLAAGASCSINITYTPTALTTQSGTATITANVTVNGSPVQLSGTGVPAVRSATLTPTTWSPTQTRNCPGTGVLGILACSLDPSQAFTLTNTGNVPLTGIAQGVLSGANLADFTINRALSTCGPTGNGQLVANTTLAPGGTCVIRVQFKPLTSEAAGAKNVSVSVTDVAGTQTSAIHGTAN